MKFSACMRSHGVPNFPNPVISNNSVSLQITPAVSKGSPQFQHASAELPEVRPAAAYGRKPDDGATGGLP